MSKYVNTHGNDSNCSSNFNIVSGNSIDLGINFCESEIKADVVVSEYNSVRLWGRIVNCNNEPVANALIKLLKIEYCADIANYEGVAHTVSDCDGFYQFEICPDDSNKQDTYYKLLVSKAAYGSERVIPISELNCIPFGQSDEKSSCDDSSSSLVFKR